MPRWLKFVLFALLLLLLTSIPLAKQFETGSIEGLITDDRGPISDASVEARNMMSGAVFRVRSGADGAYEFEDLKAGRYSIWVNARGCDSAWIPGVVVERGQTTRRDIQLSRIRSEP